MVIDKTFPKETENFEIPIKICLVAPNLSEFERMIPERKIPCVEKDHSGVNCLHFPVFQEEYEKYLNGQLDKLLTEALLLHAREWVGAMLQAIQKEKNKRAYNRLVKLLVYFTSTDFTGFSLRMLWLFMAFVYSKGWWKKHLNDKY